MPRRTPVIRHFDEVTYQVEIDCSRERYEHRDEAIPPPQPILQHWQENLWKTLNQTCWGGLLVLLN